MRDLRKFARQTQNRLVIGLVALVLIVGLGLIALFYGWPAAALGFACIMGMIILILFILLILYLIEKAAKHG